MLHKRSAEAWEEAAPNAEGSALTGWGGTPLQRKKERANGAQNRRDDMSRPRKGSEKGASAHRALPAVRSTSGQTGPITATAEPGKSRPQSGCAQVVLE